jgi:hypothetical protein
MHRWRGILSWVGPVAPCTTTGDLRMPAGNLRPDCRVHRFPVPGPFTAHEHGPAPRDLPQDGPGPQRVPWPRPGFACRAHWHRPLGTVVPGSPPDERRVSLPLRQTSRSTTPRPGPVGYPRDAHRLRLHALAHLRCDRRPGELEAACRHPALDAPRRSHGHDRIPDGPGRGRCPAPGPARPPVQGSPARCRDRQRRRRETSEAAPRRVVNP